MKVLVVMGSPRKGNTWRAAEAIRETMQAGGDVEFEYLMLRDADLAQCTGCLQCFVKGEEHCPRKDDAPEIEAKLHSADGVIFASPVYGMNVTGLMKTFVDRLSYIFHRPRFFGKKALLLTTAGAIGQKDVLKYLDLVARIWGFEVVAKVGLVTQFDELPARTRELHKWQLAAAAIAFHQAILSGKESPPPVMDVIVFNAQRASFLGLEKESPADYKYWKEHGWFEPGRRYYSDARVSIFTHLVGRTVGWFSGRQVRKSKVVKW
ncbi:MAG: flavodoxin family protein [Methanoregulaceae archaeon]|nr:flavodoxin family protein [Methanoregulaceae archaeon]